MQVMSEKEGAIYIVGFVHGRKDLHENFHELLRATSALPARGRFAGDI